MSSNVIDIVKYRNVWIGISLAVLLPGILAIIMCFARFHAPLRLGIDFTGGSILQYEFNNSVSTDKIVDVLDNNGFKGSQVQQAMIGSHEVMIIRTKAIENEDQKKMLDKAFLTQVGPFQVVSEDKVSGVIGPELLANGLMALIITFGMMVAYISYRFQPDYAVCAIIALFHDVLALIGIFAILGLVSGIEVDSLFISAILTVIGFSVHDTIVVFDRIRENSKLVGKKVYNPILQKDVKKTFGDVANDSVNQTLTRSLYTSFTVVITLTVLYFLGGITMRNFVLAMLIGIISGTYSSIFNASCLLAWWREIKLQVKVS